VAASSSRRNLRATSRVIGRKVVITFDASRPALNADTGTQREGSGFPMAQVIVQSHGGDLRQVADGRHGTRFDLELPVYDPISAPVEIANLADRSARKLTCLVVEPEASSQRRLVATLAARGHRAVPATNAEQAADLVQRMHFDAVFCASVLPGLNWLELYRRIRRRVASFALLADASDPETARVFEGGEGRLLVRPVDQRELNDFLAAAEGRIEAAAE
jgi:CheY-like chemotaxis protein